MTSVDMRYGPFFFRLLCPGLFRVGRRLKEAGVDLSPAQAMQALTTVRPVAFRLRGQPERRGLAGGSHDARRVLKAL
jgi:hypothetical protein